MASREEAGVSGCDLVVAVAGQPNVGKSTLFNVLTGERVRVSNWSGTTVEKKVGTREIRGRKVCFVDLPGIYGLSALTLDEKIARRYLLSGNADAVLVLIDSTAPERTIYLAIQVLELTPKVVIALTKSDLAHSQGIHIHVDKLEAKLGVPVVSVSAIKGSGLRELVDALIDVAEGRRVRRDVIRIKYDGIESYINELESDIAACKGLSSYPKRWLALRLLEGDEDVGKLVRAAGAEHIANKAMKYREEIKRIFSKLPEEIIASSRYEYTDSLLKDVVVRVHVTAGISYLDKLFQIPIIGPVASAIIIFLVFIIAFIINLGFPLNVIADLAGASHIAEAIETYSLSGLLTALFDYVAELVRNALTPVSELFASLIADGVVGGVGAVLSFFPLIFTISAIMAVIEDSGLGPRIALALHNFFSKFGLSGKAAYPMFISMGCNVPGVMGSRVAVDEAERLQMVLSLPYILCQARLIVLLFAVSAFFTSPLQQAGAVVLTYVVSIVVFLLSSLALRYVIFKIREPPELLIEIPPLHKPNIRVVWWLAWDSAKHFLKKAGIIIFALSVITWLLLSYGPNGPAANPSESYAAIAGATLAPALSLLYGLDHDTSWRIGFALINGFIAKEGLISAIAVMQGVSEEAVFSTLNLTLVQGIAILLFLMLYVPCLATVAVIYQETKSLKWTVFSIIYMVAVATVVSVAAYVVGGLLA